MVPLCAEKPILTKFHGKTKRFTEAVDLMKKVLHNIDKEAKKNDEKMKRKEKEAEYNKRVEKIKRNPGHVVLSKLKPIEIDKWTKLPKLTDSQPKKKRCLQNSFKMKLRNRD